MYYNHDDYYTQSDWANDNGYVHEDDMPEWNLCADLINEAQEALYESGDVNALENALDGLREHFELVAKMKYTNVSLDPKLSNVGKKETLFSRFSQLTRSYAKSLSD